MNKRAFSVLFLFLAACLLLTACGKSEPKDLSGSKYLGTWRAVSMSLKDEVGEFSEETFLILNADGTAKFTSKSEVSECKWEETKDGFKLKDGTKLTFTDEDDGIKAKILGVELHFAKEE